MSIIYLTESVSMDLADVWSYRAYMDLMALENSCEQVHVVCRSCCDLPGGMHIWHLSPEDQKAISESPYTTLELQDIDQKLCLPLSTSYLALGIVQNLAASLDTPRMIVNDESTLAYAILQWRDLFPQELRVPIQISARSDVRQECMESRINPWNQPYYWLQQLQLFCWQKADIVTSDTAALARSIETSVTSANVTEVFAPPILHIAKPKLEVGADNAIVFYGELSSRNNVDLLAEAFEQLRLENLLSTRLSLLFLGQDGPNFPAHESMTEYLKNRYQDAVKLGFLRICHKGPEEITLDPTSSWVCFPHSSSVVTPQDICAIWFGLPWLAVEGSGIQEYLPPENGCLAGGSDVQSLKNVILKAQSVKTAARFSNTTPTGCAPNYNELHNAIDPRTTFQDAGAISAVITCYNMGEFIEETVFSLWAGLDRDRDEVIVVDDGSTDDLTVQVLDYLEKTAECQIVRTRNYGVSAARNFGISKSSHDIVIVWDGDDLMQPDFVERGRKALINNPRVGALYPWLKREPSIDGHIRYNWDFAFPWGLCSNTGVSLIMLRKEAFLSTAGYNQEMKYNYADWDFLISLKEKGWECRALPLPLGIYKIRQNSMLRSITPHRRSFVLQQISRLHSQTFDRYAFEIVQLAQANSDYFLAESNPASSYDRLGKITPEREASRCMMNTLKRANKEGKRTAVIYGAGAHTIKVLSALASSPIKIIAIVDDNQEKHGRHFLGWPIVSLEDVRKLSAEALIISSDTIEPVLHNKASSVLAATNVKVYSVYA